MRNVLSLFDLGEAEAAVTQGARVIVILLLAWVLQRVASRILRTFSDYMSARRAAEDLRRIRTVQRALNRFATVVIAIVAGTLVPGELGISVVPILDDVEIVGVERWEPRGLVLRCRLKATPAEQWVVRRAFMRRLKAAFEERGIQSP